MFAWPRRRCSVSEPRAGRRWGRPARWSWARSPSVSPSVPPPPPPSSVVWEGEAGTLADSWLLLLLDSWWLVGVSELMNLVCLPFLLCLLSLLIASLSSPFSLFPLFSFFLLITCLFLPSYRFFIFFFASCMLFVCLVLSSLLYHSCILSSFASSFLCFSSVSGFTGSKCSVYAYGKITYTTRLLRLIYTN